MYAELFQRPIVWIRESSIPTVAAVVAAPIWKLCPANLSAGRLAFFRASCTAFTKLSRVSGRPSFHMNKGPGFGPLVDIYESRAATGHRSLSVRPIVIWTPSLKGSVFDFFSLINMIDGFF